jgi:hypothetical protein
MFLNTNIDTERSESGERINPTLGRNDRTVRWASDPRIGRKSRRDGQMNSDVIGRIAALQP